MSTAAALIIGNEILTGKVQDANSLVLAKILFERGVDLKRIETIPDEIDVIVSSVRRLSKEYTYVFTSGGIGPTHDDKTYEAIASAFGRTLQCHEASLRKLTSYIARVTPDKVVNEARRRMVFLPTPCEIIESPDLWVPLVVVENVYVLPGIPKLFEYMLTHAQTRFLGVKRTRVLVYTMHPEGDIASELARVQSAFPDVDIGSYPKYEAVDYRVMVSVEGVDVEDVEAAAKEILTVIEGFRKA